MSEENKAFIERFLSEVILGKNVDARTSIYRRTS